MGDQTVFIVDDDSAVRDSVKKLVESVGLQAKVFVDALEFLEQYDDSHVGCIVLDIRMARLSGLSLQNKLNELDSVIPIIFITAYADVTVLAKAFRNGAFDLIIKPYQEQKLLDTINDALLVDSESRIALSEKVIFKRKVEDLTVREKEVLRFVADGMTNNEVAKHLSISSRTVEVHRYRALKKLGTNSVIKISKYLSD